MNFNKKKLGVLLAVIITGFSLRPSITGIGSVLKLIKPDLGLSDTAAGLITTIPLLAFAFFSPFVGKINVRLGTRKTMLCGFFFIIAGTLIRSYVGAGGLFAGTLIIGIGIACGNVIIPAIIKENYAEHFGLVTALNSAGMAISSGIASGINYPVASVAGWKNALCVWLVPALVTFVIWIFIRGTNAGVRRAEGASDLLRNPTAWAVTLFMGIVCLLFYGCISWLSTIFQEKGLDAVTAGYYVSGFQLMGIPSSLIVPLLAGRHKDQRRVTFFTVGIFLVGMVTMALANNAMVLLIAALLSGFACNGAFALAMAFLGFRAKNGNDAARLSGMSQSIGNLLAALGPIGMGWLKGMSGSWNAVLWINAALICLLFVVGGLSAKEGSVA